MVIDEQIAILVAVVGAVIALGVAYGKLIAPYQEAMTQAVIDAFDVPSKYRRATSIGVGILIAAGLTVVAAPYVGTWAIVPAGIFAGILSAVEAGKVHDQTPSPPSAT